MIDEARQCIERSSHRELPVGARLHGLEGDGASGFAVDVMSDHEGPEDSAARMWRHSAIDRALDTLQESEQQVMVAYMQGASMAEIADSRGVAPGTMKVRFEKTTRKLRARAPALRRILLDTEAP